MLATKVIAVDESSDEYRKMIARLFGELVYSSAPELVVNVQGVGYEVFAPMTTFYQIPALGKTILLYTHLAVSETSQTLYGFINENDRKLFRLLIKVSGVGPKMAIGIMSMDSDDIVKCIMEENVAAMVKVPGVGKKTAERLIIEMRDKLKDWFSGGNGEEKVTSTAKPKSSELIVADAESALIALGYKPTDAAKAISRVYSDDIARSEDLIRLALRSMLPAK